MPLIPLSLQKKKNKQAALLSVICNKMYLRFLLFTRTGFIELYHDCDICQGWTINTQATLMIRASVVYEYTKPE